ncbi:hypothetical protein J437_LFUL019190 [Ladona fulva]|uniref:Integrase catalytic domain-containing protein n=1 Tax=Ladona fulva TaxID=123851 RepID=A0A8K0P2S8_LADFU|nr:hypothetical protein J437_LFUL019190 [Ladona fulva]
MSKRDFANYRTNPVILESPIASPTEDLGEDDSVNVKMEGLTLAELTSKKKQEVDPVQTLRPVESETSAILLAFQAMKQEMERKETCKEEISKELKGIIKEAVSRVEVAEVRIEENAAAIAEIKSHLETDAVRADADRRAESQERDANIREEIETLKEELRVERRTGRLDEPSPLQLDHLPKPRFAGRSSKRLLQFLKDLESYFTILAILDKTRKRYLHNFLEGNAKIWADSVCPQSKTYGELKAKFLEDYLKASTHWDSLFGLFVADARIHVTDCLPRNIVALEIVYASTITKTKFSNMKYEGRFCPIIPNGPRDLYALDLYGPLPSAKLGNKFVLVVVDVFSKFVGAYPLRKANSKNCLRSLTDKYFPQAVVPKRVIFDRGTQFTSEEWKKGLH